MKKFTKFGLVALLILGLTFALVGCGGKTDDTKKDASTDTTKKEEKKALKVATEAAYAPFEYKDKDGKIIGFDAEYVDAVAKAAGFSGAELTHVAWDGLIPALNQGTYDAVISAMTITDERKKSTLFSDPYLNIVQAVAVKEGSTIKTLDDLKGKKIGVQNNTTGHYWAAKMYNVKPEENFDKIKKFDTTPDALEALKTGAVEAVVADRPVVLAYIKENPTSKLTKVDSDKFEKEFYGIAMKSGNTELATKINEGIKKVKEDGTYDKLSKKYFPE